MPNATGLADHSENLPWWMKQSHILGSYFTSGVIHLLILLIMALFALPAQEQQNLATLIIGTELERDPDFEPQKHFEITPNLPPSLTPTPDTMVVISEKILENPSPVELKLNEKELMLEAKSAEFLKSMPQAGELSGRSEVGRSALARSFGGTPGSEAAVADGLEWLKRHQSKDGSWNFDHTCPQCDDTCSQPGNLKSATVAATAMAMLCYVGAGHTHKEGAYKDVVSHGLDFLKSVSINAPTPGDMRQLTTGNSGMYTQGIVTILFCEMYGLTKDREIGRAAQSCMKFVIEAQHPTTGGWRYSPGAEQGDTSVVGWQVMAMTSARMSRIAVPLKNRKLADKFLDSVQLEEGAYYGYTAPQKKASTTAIGLLCRMYHGWNKEHAGLRKGVAFLSELGPARDNMYYNYYATQVLHHWGGDEWTRWNATMREMLVQSQSQEGHSKGSWIPRDPHGQNGGRHYMTCLAILTLEVYYRHLPIYQQRSLEVAAP